MMLLDHRIILRGRNGRVDSPPTGAWLVHCIFQATVLRCRRRVQHVMLFTHRLGCGIVGPEPSSLEREADAKWGER